MSWDKKMLWIVIAAREEAQARPGSPTRGIFHHFIRFIPISQTPTLPQSHNLTPSFLSSMVRLRL